MSITVAYTFGFADYVELVQARRGFRRWVVCVARIAFMNVVFVAVVATASVLVTGAGPFALFDRDSLPELAVCAGVLTLLGLLIDWNTERRRPRRSFGQMAIRDESLMFELGEAIVASARRASGRTEWAAVVRAVETDHGLFLFVSEAEAILLPRRALATSAEYDALRALVLDKVGRERFLPAR
jgi:hypothetical protein